MTRLALDFSRYVNGVSMRHEEVSQTLFVNHRINAVTNGVHATTWTSPSFKQIYDRYIPEWRRDNLYLRYAIRIPVAEIWHAHQEAKKELLQLVERRTGRRLDPGLLTIGFARRAAAYKRSDLLFRDVNRLREVVKKAGGIQIIYGGKAHPTDEPGKDLIRRVFQAAAELGNDIPVVYLEEYDLSLAKYLCAGVDLWLNTPQKPHEASGTSGMKAALNGVPSLSVLDGWWIEGHIEAVTGWAVGDGWRTETDLQTEVTSLYDKLEFKILPLYYRNPDDFAGIMRSAIAMNGSYFNAQRMIVQYLQNAYIPAGSPHPAYPG
jgi:starch phosphorylase